MLNVIIYEDKENFMKKNIDAINKSLVSSDIDYRIHKFYKYSSELNDMIKDKNSKKIYILDVEMDEVTGLEIASRIREDDYDSIIIFATAYDKYHNDVFYSRFMVLDFICKYNGYEERLIDDLKTAIKILYKEKTVVFSYNHVVYRIPYNHICYIEKEPLIKRCIIHTFNNSFYIVKPINWLDKNLNANFLKIHQSCIINLDNVKEIDRSSNIITFKNGDKTCLLASRKKKELMEYVGVNK